MQRFLGIRFAQPPVGERRWQPPEYVAGAEPLGKWAPDCPQPGSGKSRAAGQSEDCLFLNVWTPTAEPTARLPVLVWFYGGSFMFGSASDPTCDGERLATDGAVVVTAAYRVGLLGFLAHPGLSAESEHGSSGNYGLLDVMAALRWVREHIGDYGGDPGCITAFGVSAGSAALALLQTSPLARGAFDRLILQSPGAFRPLASLSDAEDAAEQAYGSNIGLLRSWPADEVLRRAAALVPRVRGLTSPRLLRPIRDGWVIRRNDRDAYRNGDFDSVPTLVGGNFDEGGNLTAGWPIETVDQYRELMQANFGEHVDDALRCYPAASDANVPDALAAVFGDTQFSFGARGIAHAVAKRQPATYRYLYTRRDSGETRGPGHGAEVAGLFAQSDPAGAAMAGAWLRFATDADPNGGTLPHWDACAPALDNYLQFGNQITSGSRWRTASLDFLDTYFGA